MLLLLVNEMKPPILFVEMPGRISTDLTNNLNYDHNHDQPPHDPSPSTPSSQPPRTLGPRTAHRYRCISAAGLTFYFLPGFTFNLTTP